MEAIDAAGTGIGKVKCRPHASIAPSATDVGLGHNQTGH